MKSHLYFLVLLSVANSSSAQNLDKKLKHASLRSDYFYEIELGSSSHVTTERFNNWAATNSNVSEAFDVRVSGNYVTYFKVVTVDNSENYRKWRKKAKEADAQMEASQNVGAVAIISLFGAYVKNVSSSPGNNSTSEVRNKSISSSIKLNYSESDWKSCGLMASCEKMRIVKCSNGAEKEIDYQPKDDEPYTVLTFVGFRTFTTYEEALRYALEKMSCK